MINLILITRAIRVLAVDWDRHPNLCYADCLSWHGCDCPRYSPR